MAHEFFSSEQTQGNLQRDFTGLRQTVGDAGRRATQAGLQQGLDFDPSQAVSEFGRGFLDEAREGLGQDFESLIGSSVGQGRLRTGFFQRDSGRLFQDFNRRVSNAIAQQSLEASRQRLQNLQGLQGFGANLLGQQADVLGGAFDRGTAERNARGGNVFGKILGTAGGFLLPGIGTGLGEAIGNKIGSAFSNDEPTG